jgi:preprotein translocase subunit SecE
MATTRTTPAKFFREVRQEVSKVTWPTRKETMITTAMVFVMVVLASLFFLAVDWGLGTIIDLLVFRRPGQ